MDWGRFFKLFLPGVLAAPLLAGLILGVIGFFVSGAEGFINGATWGVSLGLVAVPFTAYTVFARYWGDYSGRYGAAWIKKETEGVNRRR